MGFNFHLVSRSSYPLWVGSSLYALAGSFACFFKFGFTSGIFISILVLVIFILLWSKDIVLEGLKGEHGYYMQDSLKFSFLLFIFSEVCFFGSVFWAFFDSVFVYAVDSGEGWSPSGVTPINPLGLPLFNTVILLSSGATATWAHHNLLSNKEISLGMGMTLLLAVLFEGVQGYEYYEAGFSMSDGIFGSVFFMATGFHGIHVMLGGLFLWFNFYRSLKGHFSSMHHLSLEAALIYWHFVDVVWLFLFVFVYWWAY